MCSLCRGRYRRSGYGGFDARSGDRGREISATCEKLIRSRWRITLKMQFWISRRNDEDPCFRW
jgi:hypothetical protein